MDLQEHFSHKDLHRFLILESLHKLGKIGQNHSPLPKLLPMFAESLWWQPFFQELTSQLLTPDFDFVLFIFLR